MSDFKLSEPPGSPSTPEEWEQRFKTLLRSNNSELIKQLELVLGNYGFSAPVVAPEEEEDLDDSIPNELWSELEGSNGSNGEMVESSRSPVSKGSRLSITSLDSGDDKLYQEKLMKDQKKANRKAFGRASGVVRPTGMMHHTKRIVNSWMFEVFFASAILSNSLLIGVQVHYAAQSMGSPLPPAFFIVEQVYALLFLVELILRVLAEGWPFFWSSPNMVWNYLDVIIVFTSVLNLVSEIAMDQLASDADALMSGNVRIIRILRVTRVIRVVRVVKIVRFIRALRSLVHSIFGTLKVLMWSVLLLMMIIYVFAIVFTDVSTEYISNFEISATETAFLRLRFSDLERSMRTLFQSISNGLTWGEVADNMYRLSWIWGYLYLIYAAFCCFVVLNVMTGVFCQSAIESAERDQELHVQSVVTSKQQQVEMFMSVFKSIQIERGDVASENLTYMEFEALFNEPHIQSFFQSLDVETSDAWTLFKLMDTSGNGDLDATEFVEGCMRLKGPARSIDVSLLMQEHKRLRKKLLTMDQLPAVDVAPERSESSSAEGQQDLIKVKLKALCLAQGQKASGSAKSMMIHSNLYWFGFICFSHFNPIAVAERAKVNQNTLELDVSVSRSSESSGSPTSLAETSQRSQRSQRRSQPSDKSKCSEWSSLRLILEKLGVHQLSDPKLGGKIRWVGCYVWKIRLTDATLSGTLDDRIGELQRLHHLDLRFTKVAGNLSSLQRLTKLQFLNLQGAKISGDISSLKPLTQLLELYLDSTEVTGDLLNLQKATQIRKLYLGSTSITGDLKSLQQHEWLQDLVLADTKVTGELADLQHLRKTLFTFHAENTLVTGDLSKIIWTELVQLKLTNTKVTGNLRMALKSKELKEIDLAGTNVSGDISALFQWKQLEEVDLSGTQMSGRLGRAWRGQVPELRILKLTNCKRLAFIPTGEGLLDLKHQFFSNRFPENLLLPKLIILELSGSPLNGNLMDLLGPLGMCLALASIRAAGCGLTGRLPSLLFQDVWLDHDHWSIWHPALAASLQTLDLASNQLSGVDQIPQNIQSLILAGNPEVDLRHGVLRSAIVAGTFLDLQHVRLTNSLEAKELLEANILVESPTASMSGYACHDLSTKSLQITPEDFLPEELCSCAPGWAGTGANCTRCANNTFSSDYSGNCQKCPEGSRAEAAGTSCRCAFGELLEAPEGMTCGCEEGYASDQKSYVPCHNWNLACPTSGMELRSALPKLGFARLMANDKLALPCLPPRETRCNSSAGSANQCANGYQGILCSDCAEHFFATDGLCKAWRSDGWMRPERPEIWYLTVSIIAVLLAGLAYVWMQSARNVEATEPKFSAKDAIKEQLKGQGPILLQMCQLWAVLALLSKDGQDGSTTDAKASPFWEIPYVEALQFSLESFKDGLNLQCRFQGVTVRLACALMAPMAPLLVLMCCLVVEVFARGSGISAGLQAVALLYIGGASSASKLLRCQSVDGEGGRLPKELAFRKWLPHLFCHDESLQFVDVVGYASAVCYGLVIPFCLVYLYAKQHAVLRPGRATVAAAVHQEALEVRLVELKGSSWDKTSLKERALTRRLVAASAAYISVLMRGRVNVQLKDGVVVVKAPGQSSQAELGDVLSLVKMDTGAVGTSLKCRAIAEMLMERCILEEAEGSERILAGSKNLLLKYARCRSLYMEIVQKLVAVALVSVVGSEDSLELSFAITMAMAATSAMVQPFLHPQVNALQCCCFLCLALAAVSFGFQWAWLSRSALAVPFLLSFSLTLRPDSTHGLAVRLWQDLRQRIQQLEEGQMVEILVETFTFL